MQRNRAWGLRTFDTAPSIGSHDKGESHFMALDVRMGPLAASLSLRRMTAALCLSFLISTFGTVGIAAETYPSRPIRLLIGFPAGGPADISGRAIAERLSQSLGVPVVPENKPGAGGMLAMQELISSPFGSTGGTGSEAPRIYYPARRCGGPFAVSAARGVCSAIEGASYRRTRPDRSGRTSLCQVTPRRTTRAWAHRR